MSKFKYKFSRLIYIASALGILLAVACFIWNIVRLVKLCVNGSPAAYDIISVSVAIIMSVGFIAIITALFIDSSYIFEDKMLIVKFGFIKNTIDYKTIKQIVWFKENNKLTIYYTDESFSNIVISDNEYKPFADKLIERNPKIIYYEDINAQK